MTQNPFTTRLGRAIATEYTAWKIATDPIYDAMEAARERGDAAEVARQKAILRTHGPDPRRVR